MTRSLKRVQKSDLKGVEKKIKDISILIQQRRQKLGITQEELSEMLDVSVSTVKYLEQGRRIPSLPVLLIFLKYLKLELIIREVV